MINNNYNWRKSPEKTKEKSDIQTLDDTGARRCYEEHLNLTDSVFNMEKKLKAHRSTPALGPLLLSDEIRVSTGKTEATALLRDVSLYRTYSYVVTNTSLTGAAQVSLSLTVFTD